MSDELEEFYVHTVTVRTFVGDGAYGPVYDDSPALECFVVSKRQLVRNQNGDQVVSETTITAPIKHGHWFTPESEVTFTSGNKATVISRGIAESGDLELPDHVAITLT